MKYFLLSLLAYFVYHQIIAPMFYTPPPSNSKNYETQSNKHPKQEYSNKAPKEFTDYEEITD